MPAARVAAAVLIVAAVVGGTPEAHADAKQAWAAAKANVPAATNTLVGIDVDAVTASKTFSLAFPLLLSQQPDVKAALGLIGKTCSIDPVKAIDGVVVATVKDRGEGAVYLALDGLPEARLIECLTAIATSQGKTGADAKVGVVRDGPITELSMGGDKVYTRWFGNVLVVPLDLDDKAMLEKWTGAKRGLARAPVGKVIRKVNTRDAVWVVTAVGEKVDGAVEVKMGYGSLGVAKGNLDAKLNLVMASAADAKVFAAKAKQDLDAAAAGLADNLKALVAGVTIAAKANEVAVRASIAESSLLSLAGALMRP